MKDVILVTYFKNGDLKSEIAKERMFEEIIIDLEEQGREFEAYTSGMNQRTAVFKDGTKVILRPFGIHTVGMKLSKVYIDESILAIPKVSDMISETYKPCSREIYFFSIKNNELIIKESE